MHCPSCDHINRPERRFCGKCGAPLGELCAVCGAPNEPDEHFCGNCGNPLSSAAIAAKPSTSGRAPSASTTPEAERRHLTVMFCDLVGSTSLATRLDDEDFRDVVRRYYDACAATIIRYEGHVANYLGDGLLVYFGYPRAHEDDAERAVRAGLAILATLARDLNATLEAERGVRLATRIGIHTGTVVVGDLEGGAHRESIALGETVNLAARLQSTAAADTVVISGATLRLVRGIFVVEDLGPQQLKGIAELQRVFRVTQPSGVRSRLDVAAGRLTPFVGRDVELATVGDRWERAEDGEGQNVLVLGEAGVGKSRLIYQFREHLAAVPHTWLECGATPYTADTPFHPVIALVTQGLAFTAGDSAEEKLAKLERGLGPLASAESVALLADFVGLPVPTPLEMSPDFQRRKTLELLAAWNLAISEAQPVVILVEDLHWCDASSLELLGRLIAQSPTARVLFLGTARPEFTPPWPARSNLITIQLARLTKRQAHDMVGALGGTELPAGTRDALVHRSDRVPLYIEELMKAVVEPGASHGIEAIPATLADSLMARLDRLSATKEVAQRGAVLGREFSYALLAPMAEMEEAALRQGLERLLEAEILFARGEPPHATYTFKHALVQEAAYQSLLKRRRQQLHARVAEVLVEEFPTRAAAQPEVLAWHYEAAGLTDQAVSQYQRAGEQAAARSAHAEAISHLRRGIALLATLPQGADRDGREVLLQLALGASLIAARGYAHPGTGAAYDRVHALSSSLGNPAQRAAALYGLSVFHMARGEPQQGVELAETLFALAGDTKSPDYLLLAHVQIATPELFQGQLASSLAHCEEAIAIYRERSHRGTPLRYGGVDQGVGAFYTAALDLALLGYLDRALERGHEAVGLARILNHPLSLAAALFWESAIHWFRRDPTTQRTRAEEAIALSEAEGFPIWLGLARALRGATRASAGADATAAAEVSEGLALAAGTGNQLGAPALFALVAESHAIAGHYAEGLGAVETGLAISAQTGQHFWDADLHRLKGEMLFAMQVDNGTDAEMFFRRASEIARTQGSRVFELRATTSLARLWQRQDKPAAARALLAPVYDSFTEGLETCDLLDAKSLLAELEHRRVQTPRTSPFA